MYYSGLPFTERSLLEEIPSHSYFRAKEVDTTFAKTIYERVIRDVIDVVVYKEVNWDNPDLVAFHGQHHPEAFCFTENKVADRVYKLTIVRGNTIRRYEITQYDHLWRIVKEHFFDANHLLVEYRQWFYENDEAETPSHEKIFFPWHISEEVYEW